MNASEHMLSENLLLEVYSSGGAALIDRQNDKFIEMGPNEMRSLKDILLNGVISQLDYLPNRTLCLCVCGHPKEDHEETMIYDDACIAMVGSMPCECNKYRPSSPINLDYANLQYQNQMITIGNRFLELFENYYKPKSPNILLASLGMTTRVINALARANFYTIDDVIDYVKKERRYPFMMAVNSFGPGASSELANALARIGVPEDITEFIRNARY